MQKNKLLPSFSLVLIVGFSLGIFSHVHATESSQATCPLSAGPSKSLSDYINNLNKELSDIRTAARKGTCDKNSISEAFSRLGTAVLKVYNRNSGFANFSSSIDFWIHSTIDDTLPPEIVRDYLLLQKQTTKIENTLDIVYKGCSPEAQGQKSVIESVLSDHILIMQDYLQIVTGKGDEVNPSFTSPIGGSIDISSIKNDYSDGTIDCIANSQSSQVVSDLTSRIGDLSSGFDQGFKDWKSAWSLISGSDPKNYTDVEARLLKKELGKQGLSTQQSAAILRRLGEVNKQEVGVTNFLRNIGDQIQASAKSFAGIYNTLHDDLYNGITTPNTMVYIKKLNRINTSENIILPNNSVDITIGRTSGNPPGILDDYNSTKALIEQDNTTLEQGIARVKLIHETMNATIADIKANIKTAQALCNSQAKNAGGVCIY